MSNKCCSWTGKEGKTKEVLKDREVRKVAWDKVVCERWCVTKLCVKDSVVKNPGCPKVVGSILGTTTSYGKITSNYYKVLPPPGEEGV